LAPAHTKDMMHFRKMEEQQQQQQKRKTSLKTKEM